MRSHFRGSMQAFCISIFSQMGERREVEGQGRRSGRGPDLWLFTLELWGCQDSNVLVLHTAALLSLPEDPSGSSPDLPARLREDSGRRGSHPDCPGLSRGLLCRGAQSACVARRCLLCFNFKSLGGTTVPGSCRPSSHRKRDRPGARPGEVGTRACVPPWKWWGGGADRDCSQGRAEWRGA